MSSRKWKNKDALVTAFDDKLKILKQVINESKFQKRANGKPMCAEGEPDNPHTATRGDHERESADQAALLAEGLGLNEVVAEIGMLWHDAGQPFGAHDGEAAMNIMSEILNVGFFHHNAKGVEVILAERMIPKIIERIPEAKDDKELRNKLKDDIWYFMEFVVGHDGEATSKDNAKYAKSKEQYASIKERVLANVSKANRTNDYKCAVETLEAQLSKPADILSYMKSDVLTGFSKGVITRLSDDYLELVGKLLDESEEETLRIENDIKNADDLNKEKIIEAVRNERVNKAKRIIREIKIEKLKERESAENAYSDSEREIFEELDKYIEELDEKGIEITDIKPEEMAIVNVIKQNALERFEKRKIEQGEDKNTIISQKNKFKKYIRNIEKNRKRVIETLMTRVQTALREDYIQSTLNRWEEIEKNEDLTDEERYSLKKQSMDFSDKVRKIIYGRNGIKDLNYREIVQYVKKEYQTGILPQATLKLIQKCSRAVVRTGIIINKFYDPEVIKDIDDEQLIELMQQRDIDDEQDEICRKTIDRIKKKANEVESVRNTEENKFSSSKKLKQKIERITLYSDIYRYIDEQKEGFTRTCKDIYDAIPFTVRNIVEKAVRTDYEENEYLPIEEKNKVYETKRELAKRFGTKTDITKENLEAYINEQIEKEREGIELKVAMQYCRDYIAGKDDEGIKELLIRTGMATQEEFEKENKPKKGNKVVQGLSQTLRDEDDSMQK